MKSMPLVLAFFVLGCDTPPLSSTQPSALVTAARPSPTVVSDNRIVQDIADAALAVRRIEPGKFELVQTPAIVELLKKDTGLELFSLLASCAIPADLELVSSDGIEFFGELGLAQDWLYLPLRESSQKLISGCVFAKLSGTNVASPISLRVPHVYTSDEERDVFSAEEGAFYGNMFDTELVWSACSGKDLDADPVTGGLIDRVCAKEDPEHPGTTMCGFTYMGKCRDVCDHPPAHHRGAYRSCSGVRPVTVYVQP
jgi:hypothetical protein